MFVNHKPKSSIVVCCHERELCGFVHGDDFIVWRRQDGTGILLARMSMDGFDICVVLCCPCEVRKKFDCTNESGVREIRERQDPGVHSRLHRELSDGRGSDEHHEFEQVEDFPGRQD